MKHQIALSRDCLSMLVALCATVAPSIVHAADPTTADCLSASEKSIALRNTRELRAARAELLVCAAESCPADVRSECMRRVAEVNAAIPTIIFEVKDSQGHDLSAVKITMDGKPLVERLEGIALSIDPGERTFVFEALGHAPVTKTFVIAVGTKNRRERIVLEAFNEGQEQPAPAESMPVLAATPPAAAAGTQDAAAMVPEDSGSSGTQRILGWTATGLGGVGLALGVVFQVNRSGKLSERDEVCPAQVNCAPGSNAQIDALENDARTASTLGVVSFVTGAALVAGGLALVFTAPRDEAVASVAVRPVMSAGFQGVSVTSHVW